MAFFTLSPSVVVNEVDATFNIPAVSTSAGGFAGTFQWGPVEQFVYTTSPSDLQAQFYQPNDDTAISYFTAENFLQYSANLAVVRVVGTTAKNATASGTGQLIKNQDDYDKNFSTGAGSFGAFAAKYAGKLGNGIRVSICDSANYSKTLAGTVTVSLAGTAVTGVGTTFLANLAVGSILRTSAGVVIGTVAAVASDTALTLAAGSNVALTAEAGVVALWEFYSQFGTAPSTSSYAKGVGGLNDEIHVVVIDTLGNFSPAPNTILKTYAYLSVASDAVAIDGSVSYYKSVINADSPYIWFLKHPTTATNWGQPALSTTFSSLLQVQNSSLSGGVSDDVLTDAIATKGFAMFANDEAIDINLIPVGGASPVVANSVISNVAQVRRDSIVFVSPKLSDVYLNAGQEVASIITTRNLLPSTDRGFMDSGWKYQFDRYNGVYRWIPLNGDTAGIAARTDNQAQPWTSPAGYNRGQYKNVAKLAFSPNKAERDRLFPLSINPVVSQKGQGTVLLGDKTLLSRPSSFDAIGVRRLFDTIEKAIANASKYKLFEFNDSATRASFLSSVNPFLRTVKGARGVTDFKVICDTSNNTSDVINSKGFVASIFIVPNQSIRGIQLNFINTPTGASFQEITGG